MLDKANKLENGKSKKKKSKTKRRKEKTSLLF